MKPFNLSPRFAIAVGSIAILLNSSPSSANEHTGYVGGLVGALSPNGTTSQLTGTAWGLTVGGKFSPQVGVGLFGTYFGNTNNVSIAGTNIGTNNSNVNLCAEFNLFVNDFHFGADAGALINTVSGYAGPSSLNGSNTSFIYGPEAGIDLPLAEGKLSLGAEIHYLVNAVQGSNNNLLALGAIKVWL